jgi:ABC-2 type transport system ATP-binding protein
MIEIAHLFFNYSKNDNLFNDLNLNIAEGGICGLLGKNGAGKTTLLKIIAGLIFPQQGSCQVFQQNPGKRNPSLLSEIYFLSEDLYVPPITAEQYIAYYAPFYPRFNKLQFLEYAEEFSIATEKRLTDFSHGQKKKFLIAFGLATNCRLFILDEPTNGLDIPSKAQFRKLLASTITNDKLIIISTHQVHDIENLIDTIVILEEGKIILNASLFEISKQLAFMQQAAEPDASACIYYEKHLAGYTAVVINESNHDTNIDLEVLFNAVLANKNKIAQLGIGDK